MKKCIEIKGEDIDIRVNSDGVIDHNKNREVMDKVYQAAAENHPNLRVAFDSNCHGHATISYVSDQKKTQEERIQELYEQGLMSHQEKVHLEACMKSVRAYKNVLRLQDNKYDIDNNQC